MRPHPPILSVLLALTLLTMAEPVPATTSGGDGAGAAATERLEYEWQLQGFLGTIARLLFPGRGEGLITAREIDGGMLETELHITSSASERGEFWLYGARVDPGAGSTREVWTAYKYKEKDKEKSAPVAEEGVIDIASGIYLIRLDPPKTPRSMKIWSDGKIYPVRVVPGEWRDRELVDGSRARARVYRIVGGEEGGDGRWKGELEIWLADDEVSTPVEILVERSSIRVRLRLLGRDALTEAPTAAGR